MTRANSSVEMLALAERAEAARPNMQVHLLWEAWVAVNGKAEPVAIDRWPGWRMPFQWDRFKAMVNAEAYESAAMQLVPEGAWWSVMRAPCADGYDAEVANDDHRHAATPALALTAAALRAHAGAAR